MEHHFCQPHQPNWVRLHYLPFSKRFLFKQETKLMCLLKLRLLQVTKINLKRSKNPSFGGWKIEQKQFGQIKSIRRYHKVPRKQAKAEGMITSFVLFWSIAIISLADFYFCFDSNPISPSEGFKSQPCYF